MTVKGGMVIISNDLIIICWGGGGNWGINWDYYIQYSRLS